MEREAIDGQRAAPVLGDLDCDVLAGGLGFAGRVNQHDNIGVLLNGAGFAPRCRPRRPGPLDP